MRTFLVGLAVLCIGCPPPAPPQCQVFQRRFDTLIFQGELAQVTVGISENCFNAGPQEVHVADQVTVTVADPDDAPVPFTVVGPTRSPGSSSFDNTAVVSFTPSRPGSYRVTARFEPGIGQTTDVIHAAEWRGTAGVREVSAMMFPPDCQDYDVTDFGTVVCFRAPFNAKAELVTARGERLEGSVFAIDGNSIWRIAELGLERLVDDGAAVKTATLHAGSWNSPKIAAGSGDVWLAAQGDAGTLLLHAHVESDGGLRVETRSIAAQAVQGMAVGNGDVLVYGTSVQGITEVNSLSADGGAQRFALPFSQSNLPLVGADSDTLWVSQQTQLVGMRPSGTSLLNVPLDLPLNSEGFGHFRPIPPSCAMVPVSAGTSFEFPRFVVPRLEGTELRLENYDAGIGFRSVTHATSRHAFARSTNEKTIKIFER